MLFLEKFLYGNISPGETKYHPREEYRKPILRMEKCEDALRSELSPEGWKTFQDFTEASTSLYSLEVSDAYMDGFRTAVLMMIDVFHPTQKEDGL